MNCETLECPGTLRESVGRCTLREYRYLTDKIEERMQLEGHETDEMYIKFIKAYIVECKTLEDIQHELGLDIYRANDWSEEIIQIMKNALLTIKQKRRVTVVRKWNSYGDDVFEWAKETDCDLFDFNTEYEYRVHEYHKAKRLGFPTFGIRVTWFGRPVGYALPY